MPTAREPASDGAAPRAEAAPLRIASSQKSQLRLYSGVCSHGGSVYCHGEAIAPGESKPGGRRVGCAVLFLALSGVSTSLPCGGATKGGSAFFFFFFPLHATQA